MTKKYEFTGEANEYGLRRIRRLSDGLIGGWIASENNLSHEGICWVGGSATVGGSAWVDGSARVGGSARVCDSATVDGSAWVDGSARVGGSARVCDSATVGGSAVVGGSAWVDGSARVGGSAVVDAIGDYWCLSGLAYTATYTRSDDCLAIGCQRRTITEWLAVLQQPHEDIGNLETMLRAIFADRINAHKGQPT